MFLDFLKEGVSIFIATARKKPGFTLVVIVMKRTLVVVGIGLLIIGMLSSHRQNPDVDISALNLLSLKPNMRRELAFQVHNHGTEPLRIVSASW